MKNKNFEPEAPPSDVSKTPSEVGKCGVDRLFDWRQRNQL
jgi:hypothetical protein